MDDGSSPNDPQRTTSQTSEGDSGANTPFVTAHQGTSVLGEHHATPPEYNDDVMVLGLADQLVGEVKKLQQEVSVCRGKLKNATDIIEKMPSESKL